MKKVVIGFLVAILICAAGFAAFVYLVPDEIKEIPGKIREGIIESREREQRIAELRKGLEHIDYPSGDTTPEHLAEVLGSYSAYVELRDSKLLKPICISPEEQGRSMRIVYDTTHRGRIYWVYMVMRGEVADIKGRVITITNEGETISLYVLEWTRIELGGEVEKVIIDGEEFWQHLEANFEDIKIGDWLSHISVFINANTITTDPHGEARSIKIGER